jgi:hypothetical protein
LVALRAVHPLPAQDSVEQKKAVRPFAVPGIVSKEPSPPLPPPPPADPAALASSTASALRELLEGIGPDHWDRTHPDDVAQTYRPELKLVDGAPWCVRFSSRRQIPQGRSLTRLAFFFPPAAPEKSNPFSSAPTVRQCRLGAVWLTLVEPDTLVGDSLAAGLATVLADRFPVASESPPALTRWPASRVSRAWRSGSMLIETAFRQYGGSSPSKGELVAVASFPLAREQEEPECLPQCSFDSRPATAVDSAIAIVRQAAAIAAMPAARVRPILEVLDEIRPPPSSDTVLRVPAPRLVGVLHRWLADSGRTAQQHAATLLVADRLLALSWRSMDRTAREQLKDLGAEIVEVRFDGLDYAYDSNWRRQAYSMDPQGPVGTVAIAIMIRDNFFSASDCRADGYREVIRLVEPFLATPAGARSAAAHLALADAYRDMLTLASGGGSESLEPIPRLQHATPTELLRIRHQALSHYRAAFALDSTSAQAGVSRADAWRVQAGLLPTETRYACAND